MKNKTIPLCATQDGKAIITQFEGLYVYAYDNATKMLYMIDQDLLGLDDNCMISETALSPSPYPEKAKTLRYW